MIAERSRQWRHRKHTSNPVYLQDARSQKCYDDLESLQVELTIHKLKIEPQGQRAFERDRKAV
jgi:hypothetical protein